jgi:hypothetical protein
VALGTVLHRWLELIHDHPGQGWDAAGIERSACSIRSSLARAGAPAGSLESLEARCLAILSRALRDDELMALVGAGGAENSWSELEIYRREGCGFTRHVIDLLTADESGSLRIIDYKTGSSGTGSSGTGTSGSEAGPYAAHWAGQLDRYREIVEALNVAPITEAKVHVLDGE